MSVAHVERAVRAAMRTAEEHGKWLAYNQTALRYALVDPHLWALGWTIWSPRQCLPNFSLGDRGLVEYALLDPNGNIAVVVAIGTTPVRRRRDRARLMDRVRGMNRGTAVLTYGTRWEIYDLQRQVRSFSDKLVEHLFLDFDTPDETEEVAHALHRWISQEIWWEGAR